MKIKFYQIDAFTDQPFKGNPAAVCILARPADDQWMQNVATEMNLSETAFLYPIDNGYSLRWFTPAAEVDLCGHATLASAHALWENGYLRPEDEARFSTKSGLLTANKKGDWIEMNFPAEPEQSSDAPGELLQGLDVQAAVYIGKNRLDYLVEVESEQIVRALKPNWSLLEKVKTRGIIVTSGSSSADFDFISRAFYPAVGVNEDPVTGSAHCCLAPYWQKKFNRDELVAYQASARGGVLKVRVKGDRVAISGQAVTVMEGHIFYNA